MSIRSLTAMAVQRDAGVPRKPVKNKKPVDAADDTKGVQQGYADVLISSIPTEILAPYTFIVGVIVAQDDEYLGVRWGVYVGFFLLVGATLYGSYKRERGAKKRRFPVAEASAALIAFAAWGLVMPGSPLSAELSGGDLTVATTLITVVSAVVIGLILGKPLKQQASSAT